MKKIILTIFTFFIVVIVQSFYSNKWVRNEILHFDASGYYLYIPAAFIYNDVGELKFMQEIEAKYRVANDIQNYGLHYQKETNKKTNKYAIGVALGELPFFLIAHQVAQANGSKFLADGYSEPYQFAVAMSNIAWVIIGLLVLGSFLRKKFGNNIAALCILIIGFGTNLYCYTWVDMGMSHTLLFMLFSLVIYCTDRWYTSYKLQHAILLGLSLGWVLIARPVDFVIVLLPLLWPIGRDNKLSRFQIWSKYKFHLLLCALSCFAVSLIQLAYWKYTTGHWIHFSYKGEGFNFSDSEVINGLFSFRKGWFVYTPIAFISLLGLVQLFRKDKTMFIPLTLFFATMIYLVFSWGNWWYGWGFGARAMVETYAVVSIPLAVLLQWIAKQKIILKSFTIAVFGFFIWMNLYQTEQYIMGAIPGDNMNQKFYWRVWNKMHPNDEDWKYFQW